MGAKTWIVAHSIGLPSEILRGGPTLDDAATAARVGQWFPDRRFGPPRRVDLNAISPRKGTVVAGCWNGLSMVADESFALDRPSQLPAQFIAAQGTTVLHAMHSVADWFAYAVWQDGRLQRALSVAPDEGVMEDRGARAVFELPYWEGAHPALDPDEDGRIDYPLPFHPLELGDAALRHLFGFQVDGLIDPSCLEPESVAMLSFEPPARAPKDGAKAWWRRVFS